MATQTPPTPRLDPAPRLKPPAPASPAGVTVVSVPAGKRAPGFLFRNRVVVWFVVLLILTDLAAGRFPAVWERHSPDDYAVRVTTCAREPRDLVFVGGSPVAEAIDPARLVGVCWQRKPLSSAYSLGLSGGTTSDFYHALLRGCPTPPRLLVYGATASDLNDSRGEPHGPYSLMTVGDVVRWARTRPENREWVVRHYAYGQVGKVSNLFRYRHGIRMWAATEADEQIPGSCPEAMREADELREHGEALRTGNGYAPARGFSEGNFGVVKLARKVPKDFPFLQKYRTGSHLKYLHKLIDWCEEGGVRLVVVDMPVTVDLETMYPKAFAEYRERLAEVERDRGVMVIRDAKKAARLNDAHFADLIHMNRDGAAVFSDWLRRRLEVVLAEARP